MTEKRKYTSDRWLAADFERTVSHAVNSVAGTTYTGTSLVVAGFAFDNVQHHNALVDKICGDEYPIKSMAHATFKNRRRAAFVR